MDEKNIIKRMERNQKIINDRSIYKYKSYSSIIDLLDLEIENINDIYPNYALFIKDLVKLHEILFDYKQTTGYSGIFMGPRLEGKGLGIEELNLHDKTDADDVNRIIYLGGYIDEGEGISFRLEYPNTYYTMTNELPTFKLTVLDGHGNYIHEQIGFDENLYEEFSRITKLFIKYWEICKRIK